ncbi:MAG: prolyl oligopeptidase family serine peptidase [bacterium]|nr:prolyl oligopeptidase family serine peptidase [bacterium]
MKSATLLAAIFLVGLCPPSLHAQDELGRRALDHSDYEKWNSVGRQSLSEDGKWMAFSVRSAKGKSTLTIREVATQKQYKVANSSSARFSFDSRFAAYVVQPDPDLIKKLKKEEKRKGDMPKPRLEIIDLVNDRHVTLHNVRSFSFPEKASGWITYSPSKASDKNAVTSSKSKIKENYSIEASGLTKFTPKAKAPAAREPVADEQEPGKEEPGKKKGAKKKSAKKREKDNGNVLVLRSLESGIERRFPDVTSHRFSKYGTSLAFATSATDAEDDGVFLLDLATSTLTQVISGRGSYNSIAISEDEKQLAFTSDRDDYGPVKPSLSMYLWSAGDEEAQKIVDEKAKALPKGWWLASGRPSFTEDGRRLLFSTQPKPEDAGKTKKQLEKEKKAAKDDPKAVLDIWHWKDDALQPQQILQAGRERNRSYQALYDLEAGTMVQLATEDMPRVLVDDRSIADVAVGVDSARYAVSRSWESPGFSDSYIVDLKTGEATLVLEKVRASASLSPGGSYVTWWDPDVQHYFAMSVSDRVTVDLSDDIPTSLANELHDTPAPPRSYGSAGWLDDDAALLLYDRFDIWQVDPSGTDSAKCLTAGVGRDTNIRYRYQQLDYEQRTINLEEPLLLSAFNEKTKASGFSQLHTASGPISSMLMLDESVGRPTKARQGDTLLLTRQSFRRSPDIWATTTDFEQLSRISSANPQQRDYLWGTSELVHYETEDGQAMDGILYKPDNFDPSTKYPMMVYFYERSSNGLHRYHQPSAGGSSINFSFYVSRGYVVFVPDIPYATGHPGHSAANAILPGIQTVVDQGFVDPARIGVQGHSWGGYQIAYLVTMTNVFACAEAGAPVTNMTSAYGGIRWSSGMSRMFQYEKTQSRIGGTLWEARDLYLENSPVFFADKIETPLLMLHNDKDGAVPWYQGIELFVALRRLEKPVWMLNYNGEAHGLRKKENRQDFAKRMQQFFDHYLQGATATRWITDGVPAVDKGKEFGLEPVEPEVEAAEEVEVEAEVEAPPTEEPKSETAGE